MVGGTQARACLEAVFSVRPKAAAPPPKGDDRTAIRETRTPRVGRAQLPRVECNLVFRV